MKLALLFLLVLGTRSAHAAWQDVFTHLDLSRPGLEAVRQAVEGGDMPTAAAALKAHFRQRQTPVYVTDRFSRPQPDPNYDAGGAQKVLRREFTFVGKPYTLTHDIDWNANPLDDAEWPIELNRHGTWVTLARAYWSTGDETYAEDFAYQVADWLADNPRPASPREARWTWRTLECGIRLGGTWNEILFRFIDSDRFTPELVCGMLEAMCQQADYLTHFGGGGNWLVCEKSALVTMGIVYPEFADSSAWLKAGWDTLSHELQTQVCPDGAQIELTPHYHSATLSSFRSAYDTADLNHAPIPPEYRDRMRLMYEYLMYVVKPDGFIPMFNDSDHGNMRGWMRDGASRFDRQDMLYVATGGKEGTPPDGPSHAFPWAGQYVMRSGWTTDDVYLAIDAGPYGYGHQHEDKLTVDVWGYGQEMILDPGRYTYAGGKWRSYFLSTLSHPTMLVDGGGQNRRATPRETWVAHEPRENRWVSNADLDFVTGSYEDGYPGADDVIHVRKVLFVKPSYFVVSDLLLPRATPGGEHEATVQWQLARAGAQLEQPSLAVHSVGPSANVLVQPASPDDLTVSLHEGEEDPPAGWVAWSLHQALKEPATLVRYSRKGAPPLQFDTVILPYKGEQPPALQVKRLPTESLATELEITGPGFHDICHLGHTPGDEVWVKCLGDGAQPAKTLRLEGAVPEADVPTLDLAESRIEVASDQPAQFRLRYGYASGGGYLFESHWTDAATSAALRVQDAQLELPYVYEVQARSGDTVRATQRGTLTIPQPMAFDFEDGTLQDWAGESARLVAGFDGSKGALRIEGPTDQAVRYITAQRPQRLLTSDRLSAAFAWRTPLADGGDWFYAKLTLHDDAGMDWSCYFAKAPQPDWQSVSLSLADFRGDTYNRSDQQGKPMPIGLRITRVLLTLRKDATTQPIQPALELDDIRFTQ